MNRFVLLLSITLLTACTSTTPYQLGPVGKDGLASVEKSTFDELAIHPQKQFRQYKKMLIEPINVSFSERRRSTDNLNRRQEDFQFDEKELSIFNRQFSKAVTKRWGDALGWEPTDQPGPDVIIVRAAVTDLYLFASIKNDLIQPTYTLTNESSTMVLSVQLVDSQTGEVLLRSKDKKTTGQIDTGISNMTRLNSVKYWSDAYQTFSQWAGALSKYLD